MSTIQRVNFEPASDLLSVQRRDFGLADKTLADPESSNPLVDGEWMILDADSKAAVAADRSAADNAATQTAYLLFAEKGRWDVQAIADRKVPLLFIGEYEGDTRIFDASASVGSGAAITTVGQPLKVATVDIGGVIKVGLVGHGGAADADPIVGRVTRLPANNGGKLRFRTASSI